MIRPKSTLPPGSATTSFANSKVGVTFDAGSGHDTVLGSKYADLFQGGEGNDRMLGKKGDDTLQSGAGLDTVTGGAGSDTFVFAPGELITSRASSNGHKGQVDTITDFQGAGTSGAAAQDVIRLEGFGTGTTLIYVGQDGPGRGSPQLYEVVDPTTAGRDGFLSVRMANKQGAQLTADDVVVVPPPQPQITITDVTEGGNSAGFLPSISTDGSTVAFYSYATNLVEGLTDANGDVLDVFLYDVATGETSSVTNGANGESFNVSLSADGSLVTFESFATDLVDGPDTNEASDVFVRDVATGETVRITNGSETPWNFGASVSADGSTVVFMTYTVNPAFSGGGENQVNVFMHDLATGETVQVTKGADDSSFDVAVSADGSTLAFRSLATNLIDSETDDGVVDDVFLYDVATGQAVNITQGGDRKSFGPSLSADGSMVAFTSAAGNLVDGGTDGDEGALDIFLFDLDTGRTTNVTEGWTGDVSGASLSADGSTVAFLYLPPDQQPTRFDPIYERDLILYDVATGETVNVTEDWDGYVDSASLSSDGSVGTFSGVPKTGMWTNIYVWDLS